MVEIGPAPNQTGNLIEFYNKKVWSMSVRFSLKP
jgi:hypothetical protein